MTSEVSVFVNEQAVTVPRGVSVRDAVAALDSELALAVARGLAYVTDGVGRPIDVTAPVESGVILRVVRSARRAEGGRQAS